MLLDHAGNLATPRARSICPGCGGELVAKCGRIVTWHWAHVAADCDPWSEPESEWHRRWKLFFAAHPGVRIEVSMGAHRADVVLADGRIVELQAGYLSADNIQAREEFYGPSLVWLYRCHWLDRLHFGQRGFWWKHGSKSMEMHRRPVWWDTGKQLWRVSLGLSEGPPARVLGRVVERRPRPQLMPRDNSAQHHGNAWQKSQQSNSLQELRR